MRAKARMLVMAVAGAVLAANAAVVRKMPDMSVVEGEMVATDSMKATAVRSSNTAVFSAALRESGEAIVSGTRLGEAVLSYVDERGVFASRSVMVVPAYWEVLKGMFSEDPEISVAIVGDKVVVRGATANVDTLRRVDEVKKLDTTRIVTQVSYSTAQIGELVRDFLRRSNVTNIGVNVVGREVCLSGRMYDAQSSEQLKKRVEGFVHDFPGITVNVDELRIYKQKILINIEFVAYNDSMSRNLGFSGPEAGGKALNAKIENFKLMIGRVREKYPNAAVCATTLRQVISANEHLWGAILCADGEWFVEEPRPIPVLDRIGGGDGFSGGLLYGVLSGWDSEKWLQFGWACGVLAASSLNDYAEPADEKQVWDVYKGNARVQR